MYQVSGLIGKDPNGVLNNLMPNISRVAIGHSECLEVFGNDYNSIERTVVRDLIHMANLAYAHIAAVDQIDSLEPF